MKKLWKQRMEPFRIWGNLYFCGSVPSSCHVVDTGEGLILIDPGLPETFYLVIQSLWELGFEPKQVRAILHTHGHYDHAGATKLLLGLAPEAKTYIGAGDADTVRGLDDLSLAELVGAEFDGFFEPDVLLEDGYVLRLGNTEVKCVSTPGHSRGTFSFFFDAVDETGEAKRCGMHGGAGINSMMLEYYAAHGLDPSERNGFVPGLARVRDERVDICLGSHTYCNGTQGKGKKVLAGDKYAFVDPEEWARYCDRTIATFEAMVARGQ